MAQMAPALTEANASPGSSRKNSVDRCCSSTVPEELRQSNLSSGVDLKLLSRNGLVRLLDDSDSSNNITNTTGDRVEPSRFSSPPKISKRNEEKPTKADMPNGHCDGNLSRDVENMSKSVSTADDNTNRKPAIPSDLSQRACASSSSTTTMRPVGACNIESEKEDNSRISQHPVACFDSRQAVISKRTVRSIEQQARLESRAKKLEKRLRRLQTRQIGTHVHRQWNGIVNQHKEKAESSQITSKQAGNWMSGGSCEENKPCSSEIKAKETISASTLRSLETDNDCAYQSKGTRNASSGSTTTESRFENAVKYSPESVNKSIRNALIGEKQRYEAESLAESLTAHVEHLEAMNDSDATEASSCDEIEEEEHQSSFLKCKVSKTLRKRYQSEEGEIASQWSWLQSQIINLERQIRRYEDLYKGFRLSKQPVRLQVPVTVQKSFPLSEVNVMTASNVSRVSVAPPIKVNHISSFSEQSDLKLKSMFKEPENHLRNGVKKTLLQESMVDEDEIPLKRLRTAFVKNDTAADKHLIPSQSSESVSQSARTRGVHPISHRPLVYLSWMQQKLKFKKASCQCSMPETPCIACSKMAKTIAVVETGQLMAERVGMLDQSYHPVLSFSTEIPLQFHFASLLKKGGFETRTKPQPLETSTHVEKKKQPNSKSSNRRSQLAKGAAASLLSSAKLRNQRYDRKRGYSSLPSTPKNSSKADEERECHTDVIPRKKRAAAISAAAQLQKRARSLSLPCTTSNQSTPTSSPSPTPPLSSSMPPSSLNLLLRKKRTSNAFDINNIVIPYSMASSTRVEKLQYKEILTPSWRLLEIKKDDVKEEQKVDDSELEDLSDGIIASRHEICEEHERKRFLGYLNKKRKRSSRQSSETSNPDGVGMDFHTSNTPPGTPGINSPSPTTASVPVALTSAAITPSFHRSFSLDSRLAQRRSSSTESLQKVIEGESWPTINPWPDRTFPLSETEEASLKLPTPQATPVPSMPASPSPVSSPASPICSPLASPASDIDSSEKIGREKNEWTVKLVTTDQESSGGESGQPRKGIVLKLAKR